MDSPLMDTSMDYASDPEPAGGTGLRASGLGISGATGAAAGVSSGASGYSRSGAAAHAGELVLSLPHLCLNWNADV